eukprot:2801889-Amphidinium_carterae.2
MNPSDFTGTKLNHGDTSQWKYEFRFVGRVGWHRNHMLALKNCRYLPRTLGAPANLGVWNKNS